jgi:hypothetical protein
MPSAIATRPSAKTVEPVISIAEALAAEDAADAADAASARKNGVANVDA